MFVEVGVVKIFVFVLDLEVDEDEFILLLYFLFGFFCWFFLGIIFNICKWLL